MNTDYRCVLYKQINGSTISEIFGAPDAGSLTALVDDEIKKGWHTTPADFIDDIDDISDKLKSDTKDAASVYAGDANILANYANVKSIDDLKGAYERMTGKPMNKNIKSLKAVRNACAKALGESNVN